jgi:hypothetical protein
MIAGQNAGTSAGERLVVNWPSVTTSWSTASAPALRIPVHRLGQEVKRRLRTTGSLGARLPDDGDRPHPPNS